MTSIQPLYAQVLIDREKNVRHAYKDRTHDYRDRVFIRKDIISRLIEFGELNQSRLISYCGLNNVTHRELLSDLVDKELITRAAEKWGHKTIIKYKASEKGKIFLANILERYEKLIPRVEGSNQNHVISQ